MLNELLFIEERLQWTGFRQCKGEIDFKKFLIDETETANARLGVVLLRNSFEIRFFLSFEINRAYRLNFKVDIYVSLLQYKRRFH